MAPGGSPRAGRPNVPPASASRTSGHTENLMTPIQADLFEDVAEADTSIEGVGRSSRQSAVTEGASTTFGENMRVPVHRWFRYSAGYSAAWAQEFIERAKRTQDGITVLDPFVGSGTTLLAAQAANVQSYGLEAHPFVSRVARAKLLWGSNRGAFRKHAEAVSATALSQAPITSHYPAVIQAAFIPEALADLDRLRRALEHHEDGSPAAQLTWLALMAILRRCSHVGTAQWQYVLPNKRKARVADPLLTFTSQVELMCADMALARHPLADAIFLEQDARQCEGVPDGSIDLVLTSPPYANNFDYADATRLEMSFLGEVRSYGDLQGKVRDQLVRSCSQHVNDRTVDLAAVLRDPLLAPISNELTRVCEMLGEVRLTRGGKKNYHLMVGTYFLDMARVWKALRRVCTPTSTVCFVIGDSAPYGVYVPVIEWNAALASAVGFGSHIFEKTRDRNVKWKNRKHRVPLVEGRLRVQG